MACALWYLFKRIETFFPQKNMHMDVYIGFIHNYQKLKATKMSFSRRMGKYIVVHSDN